MKRSHTHTHEHPIVRGVNNCFAKGHNCDPRLVFKALSLNLNYPSSPPLPLVKWKRLPLGLIQRSHPPCLRRGLQRAPAYLTTLRIALCVLLIDLREKKNKKPAHRCSELGLLPVIEPATALGT